MRKRLLAVVGLLGGLLGGCEVTASEPVIVVPGPAASATQAPDPVADSCTGWDHTPPYIDPATGVAIAAPSIITFGAALNGYPSGSQLELTLTGPGGRTITLRGTVGADGKLAAASGINQFGQYRPSGPARLTYTDATGKPVTVELVANDLIGGNAVNVGQAEQACDPAGLTAGSTAAPSVPSSLPPSAPAPSVAAPSTPEDRQPLTVWWTTFIIIGGVLLTAGAALFVYGRRGKPTDCASLRAECARLTALAEQAERDAAGAEAAAADAKAACQAARQKRAAAERAVAKALVDAAATADTGSWMESEGKRITSEDLRLEREASRAAYDAYKRGEITGDQLQEEWSKSGDWEHLERLRKQEKARRQEKVAAAQREAEAAVAAERSACDNAKAAEAKAGTARQNASAAAQAAKAACAAADECEKRKSAASGESSPTSGTATGVSPGGAAAGGSTGGAAPGTPTAQPSTAPPGTAQPSTAQPATAPPGSAKPRCPEGTVRRGSLLESRGPLDCMVAGAQVHVRIEDDRGNVLEADYDPDVLAQDTSPRILRGIGEGEYSGNIRLYRVTITVPMERLTVDCYQREACRGGKWVPAGRIRVEREHVPHVHTIQREDLSGSEWRKMMPELWPYLRRAVANRDRMSGFCGE